MTTAHHAFWNHIRLRSYNAPGDWTPFPKSTWMVESTGQPYRIQIVAFDGTVLKESTPFPNYCTGPVFSQDATLLAIHCDEEVYVLKTDTLEVVQKFNQVGNAKVFALKFSRDNEYLGMTNHKLHVFQVRTGKLIRTIAPMDDDIDSVEFLPGTLVLGGWGSKSILYLYDWNTGDQVTTLPNCRGECMKWIPGTTRVLIGTEGLYLFDWTTQKLKPLKWKGKRGHLEITKEGLVVLLGQQITLFDLEANRVVCDLKCPVRGAHWGYTQMAPGTDLVYAHLDNDEFGFIDLKSITNLLNSPASEAELLQKGLKCPGRDTTLLSRAQKKIQELEQQNATLKDQLKLK